MWVFAVIWFLTSCSSPSFFGAFHCSVVRRTIPSGSEPWLRHPETLPSVLTENGNQQPQFLTALGQISQIQDLKKKKYINIYKQRTYIGVCRAEARSVSSPQNRLAFGSGIGQHQTGLHLRGKDLRPSASFWLSFHCPKMGSYHQQEKHGPKQVVHVGFAGGSRNQAHLNMASFGAPRWFRCSL